MSKAIIYCEKCGRLISPSEADRGKAMVFEQVGVCPECVASLSPGECEEVRRRFSLGPGPSPDAKRSRTTTAQKPRTPQRTEGAPARSLAGRRSHKGITVALMAAGALAGVAVALMGTSGSRKGPAKVPGGPPGAGAGGGSSPGDPGGTARTEVGSARRRLDEIKAMIDPSLGRYAEARAALLDFAGKCDDPTCSTEAKGLLAKIDADLGAMADEELEKAAKSAEVLASQGDFAGAKKAIGDSRERFGGSEWFKERGEKAITEALGKIDAARVASVKAAVARASEALRSKRFDEARAALEFRAAWPEGLRARADDLLKEIDVAEAALGDQAKRKEAWTAFLLGFTDAGKLGLREAKAFLESERKALAKLGPDRDIERKLERIERRFGAVKLVEELAEVGFRGSRGIVHFTFKGERVGGKVRRVEKGVVWLVTTRGRHVSVPIAEIAGADVVRCSRIIGQGSKEKLRAATYLLLRGDPAAARKASKDARSDAAWELGDQIDEFAKGVEAREARKEAEAEAARAAAEAARAAAEAKAAAETEAKRKVEAAARGLVGHWKLDEGKGRAARDSSGRGNHGAVTGGRWTAKGGLDGALYFDGNDVADCGDRADFRITGQLTLSAWVKVDPAAGKMMVISKKSGWNAGSGYELEVWPAGRRIAFLSSGGEPYGKGDGITWSAGWHHAAVTADRRTAKLYFDGRNVTTQPVIGPLVANRNALTLGRRPGGSSPMTGLIDDVRVYNRALSAEEVRSVFDGRPGAPRKARAGPPAAGARVAERPAGPGAGGRTVPGEAPVGTGAPQGNLVENGGFEEKDARRFAAGWTKEQWGARAAGSSVRLDRSNPHVGEGAIVVRGLAAGAKPGASTTLKLDFGIYEIRYWVCADVGKTATVGARFAGKDLPKHRAVDQWKQFTDAVTVEKRNLKSRLGFWVSTPNVRVWFDDVEVVGK